VRESQSTSPPLSAQILNGGHDRGFLLFDKLFDPIFTLALNLLSRVSLRVSPAFFTSPLRE